MAAFSEILFLRAPCDKFVAHGQHDGSQLFSHGFAKDVRLSQRKSGHLAGDLHHLFLIDDDAIGFL